MILASVLGIVVADTWWLEALERLGARRMTTIDLSKPLIALGFGALLLGDNLSMLGVGGVCVCVSGISVVVFETSGSKESNQDGGGVELSSTTSPIQVGVVSSVSKVNVDSHTPTPNLTSREAVGFLYAFCNCVLDVYAATIVVAHHGDMSPIDVNLIKFGFAGAVLACAVAAKEGIFHWTASRSSTRLEPDVSTTMDRRDWLGVAGGTCFVTVLTPIVTTWTYFKLPLAVAVTIGSLAPIWSLPLAHFHGETLGYKAIVGAVLSVLGVAMLLLSQGGVKNN